MPIPQVNDRIREAPAVMLRAVFAGVGQLLLAADKVRARAAGPGWPPDRTAPKGQSRAQSRWHTLDDTRGGTVPLARERANSHNHSAHHPAAARPDIAAAAPASTAPEATSAAAAPEAGTAAASAAPAAPEATTTATVAPEATVAPALAGQDQEISVRATPASGEPAGGGAAGDAPPLPGYDELSLPSLRARLRTLDAATLRAMLAYEKAHARRDDVIAMFERRLTKIDAG